MAKLTSDRSTRLLMELMQEPGNGERLDFPWDFVGHFQETYSEQTFAQIARARRPVGHHTIWAYLSAFIVQAFTASWAPTFRR